MFRRLAKLLIVTALASSIGLHWAALQSIAWTSMLADNLRTNCLSQAVERTFDGKHPCCLCKAIAREKDRERHNDSNLQLTKFEFPPAREMAQMMAPARYQPPAEESAFPGSIRNRPPTPPPRSFFV